MSHRQMISLAAVATLGIVCVSAEAFAARVAARGGAAAHRGTVGVRGGAIADRGAVGVRGAGYRGEVYRGGYYRPGLGVAAGAVVGGAAIAASQPWYGGGYGYDYDTNYYGSNPGYATTGYFTSSSDQGFYGSNPGYATSYSTSGGQDAAYCADRFKSYDASSGTYLGYDGQRHPCP